MKIHILSDRGLPISSSSTATQPLLPRSGFVQCAAKATLSPPCPARSSGCPGACRNSKRLAGARDAIKVDLGGGNFPGARPKRAVGTPIENFSGKAFNSWREIGVLKDRDTQAVFAGILRGAPLAGFGSRPDAAARIALVGRYLLRRGHRNIRFTNRVQQAAAEQANYAAAGNGLPFSSAEDSA